MVHLAQGSKVWVVSLVYRLRAFVARFFKFLLHDKLASILEISQEILVF